MKVAAGVVLYNPNLERLKKNIKSIIGQVDEVFIINNGKKITNAELENEYGFLKEKRVLLVNNASNYGIARALNQIVEKCLEKKYSWVLLLDQDSVAEKDMVKKLLPEINKSVSIVAPRIVDLNKKQSKKNSSRIEDVSMAITSGSLINVEDCKKMGMFDEKMFIDFVDFDYCKRVKLADKKIIKVNDAILEHEVGKRTKRRILWKTVYPTNHSPERIYYYVRNIVYFSRKYRGLLSLKERIWLKASLMWKWISISMYETDKRRKKEMYILGKRDGLKKMPLKMIGELR